MRSLSRALVFLMVLIVVALSVLAVVDNQAPVALHFLGSSSPELSIFWWLAGALLIGMVIGWGMSTPARIKHRISERSLKRELARSREASDAHREAAARD